MSGNDKSCHLLSTVTYFSLLISLFLFISTYLSQSFSLFCTLLLRYLELLPLSWYGCGSHFGFSSLAHQAWPVSPALLALPASLTQPACGDSEAHYISLLAWLIQLFLLVWLAWPSIICRLAWPRCYCRPVQVGQPHLPAWLAYVACSGYLASCPTQSISSAHSRSGFFVSLLQFALDSCFDQLQLSWAIYWMHLFLPEVSGFGFLLRLLPFLSPLVFGFRASVSLPSEVGVVSTSFS